MDYNEIENLVELAKANDKNAKEELMVKFTPLIINLSKKSFVTSYEFADIKNECYRTLFKCVNQYNPEKHRFVAYATNSIKNSVNLLIRVSIRRSPTEGKEAFILDEKLENTTYSDLEDFDNIILNKLHKNRLAAALKTLDPTEKELITYVYYKNNSLKKYSVLKDIPYTVALSRRNKILCKLKKELNKPMNINKMN